MSSLFHHFSAYKDCMDAVRGERESKRERERASERERERARERERERAREREKTLNTELPTLVAAAEQSEGGREG